MTDAVIRTQAINVLTEKLGAVGTERFIAMLLREPFDYTQWQENLLDGVSGDEIDRLAMDYCAKTASK